MLQASPEDLLTAPPITGGSPAWRCGANAAVFAQECQSVSEKKCSLSAQLSSLKAQMAAVEAQGEALRAATRTVEDECRKMAWHGGAVAWPSRPHQPAAGGG
mmetsp:Transcript_85232/g.222018  ORF Transcript_85232/g.222018 Transcript_85232/m.222018 type:complete len:102 (-) Transcript_85232:47-352(-)